MGLLSARVTIDEENRQEFLEFAPIGKILSAVGDIGEPFLTLCATSPQTANLQTLDTVRTFPWKDYQQKLVSLQVFNGFIPEKMKLKASYA
jgi:hypothetical protein